MFRVGLVRPRATEAQLQGANPMDFGFVLAQVCRYYPSWVAPFAPINQGPCIVYCESFLSTLQRHHWLIWFLISMCSGPLYGQLHNMWDKDGQSFQPFRRLQLWLFETRGPLACGIHLRGWDPPPWCGQGPGELKSPRRWALGLVSVPFVLKMHKVNSGYSFLDFSMMPGVFGAGLRAHCGPWGKDLKWQKWLGGSLLGPLDFPIWIAYIHSWP